MIIGVGGLVLAGAAFLGEILISAGMGRPLHRWADSLSALSLSLLTGLVSPFGKAFLLLLYVPLHAGFALRDWNGTVLDWLLAFLAYELSGYGFHRFSHRTNLGWAVHMAHHQSEELNLSTALRTAPLRSLLDWPTLLPLALLGIPPYALGILYLQHVAGQYWLHVQWIRSLGPLEWVLNTPSHHRVHHGCGAGYQDANYGASLILWDRLFGTFVPETHAATYGVTRPVPGWDPFRATFHPFRQVWEDARDWSPWDRLRVWLMPPGWRPDRPAAHWALPPRRESARPKRLVEAIWHLFWASVVLLSVPEATGLEPGVRALLAAVGLWSVRAFAVALEERPAHRIEALGHAALALVAAALLPPVGTAVLVTVALGSLAQVARIGRRTSAPSSPSAIRSRPG